MKTGSLLAVMAGCVVLGACASSHPRPASLNQASLQEAMTYAQEAQKAEAAGNHEKSIELGRKALALRPDMAGVWTNLGLALMHRGQGQDFVDAAQAFKRDADLMPMDERPYQYLGVLYHERGFSDQALYYFEMGLQRNPNSLECLRGAIGSAKLLRKSDDAVIEVFILLIRPSLLRGESRLRGLF